MLPPMRPSPIMPSVPMALLRPTTGPTSPQDRSTTGPLQRRPGRPAISHPDHAGVPDQIGSALAFRGIPLQSAYCGAKHGLNGFLDSVRAELVHEKSAVRITSVHLPAVNSPQFEQVLNKTGKHGQPVPPIYQPQVAADAVRWAADIRSVGRCGSASPLSARSGEAGSLRACSISTSVVPATPASRPSSCGRQAFSRHHGTVLAGTLVAGLTAAGALWSLGAGQQPSVNPEELA